MSISDELKQAGDKRRLKHSCLYGAWLCTQDEQEQANLQEAWPRIQQLSFTDICNAHGYPGSVHVIRRHYEGRCNCGDQ